MVTRKRCAFLRAPTRVPVSLVALLWLFSLGCSSQATSRPVQTSSSSPLDAAATSQQLQAIAAAGTLADLHAPNFTDYRYLVVRFYQSVNYAPVWVRDGQPTPQALVVITALEASQHKGLSPEDYDASEWPARLTTLKGSPGNADTVARFDA